MTFFSLIISFFILILTNSLKTQHSLTFYFIGKVKNQNTFIKNKYILIFSKKKKKFTILLFLFLIYYYYMYGKKIQKPHNVIIY